MSKLRQLWDIDDLPQCGTSTCPLEALETMGTTDPDVYEYTKRECYCQSEEYQYLTKHSLTFIRAREFLREQEAGLPLDTSDELLGDHIFRHAIMTLKTELKIAENELQKVSYNKSLKGMEDGERW